MLTMKDIIRDGHPTLRQKAAELELPLTKRRKRNINRHERVFSK